MSNIDETIKGEGEFGVKFNEPTTAEIIRVARFCLSPEKKGCKGCPRFTEKCIGVWGAIECKDQLHSDLIARLESQQNEITFLKFKLTAQIEGTDLTVKRKWDPPC